MLLCGCIPGLIYWAGRVGVGKEYRPMYWGIFGMGDSKAHRRDGREIQGSI